MISYPALGPKGLNWSDFGWHTWTFIHKVALYGKCTLLTIPTHNGDWPWREQIFIAAPTEKDLSPPPLQHDIYSQNKDSNKEVILPHPVLKIIMIWSSLPYHKEIYSSHSLLVDLSQLTTDLFQNKQLSSWYELMVLISRPYVNQSLIIKALKQFTEAKNHWISLRCQNIIISHYHLGQSYIT